MCHTCQAEAVRQGGSTLGTFVKNSALYTAVRMMLNVNILYTHTVGQTRPRRIVSKALFEGLSKGRAPHLQKLITQSPTTPILTN